MFYNGIKKKGEKNMYQVPYEKMVCDSDLGDGGVYFYDEYLEWLERGSGKGFQVKYKDIKDIKVVMTGKKKVIIIKNDDSKVNLYLYKYDVLIKLIQDAIDRVNGVKKEVVGEAEDESEDDLVKLERLAKLHESGALTDEEFTAAKKKILGL